MKHRKLNCNTGRTNSDNIDRNDKQFHPFRYIRITHTQNPIHPNYNTRRHKSI